MPRMLRRAAVLGATAHVASNRGEARAGSSRRRRPRRAPRSAAEAARPRAPADPSGQLCRADEAQGAVRRRRPDPGGVRRREGQDPRCLIHLACHDPPVRALARRPGVEHGYRTRTTARRRLRRAELHRRDRGGAEPAAVHDLIRLIDVLVVQKDLDGNVTAVQVSDLSVGRPRSSAPQIGALIGLGVDGEDGMEAGAHS